MTSWCICTCGTVSKRQLFIAKWYLFPFSHLADALNQWLLFHFTVEMQHNPGWILLQWLFIFIYHLIRFFQPTGQHMGDWSWRKQLNGSFIQKITACIHHLLPNKSWHTIIHSPFEMWLLKQVKFCLRERSEWIMSLHIQEVTKCKGLCSKSNAKQKHELVMRLSLFCDMTITEIITFLSVEINLNCGVSTWVKNLTSMDLQDRHVAGSVKKKKKTQEKHHCSTQFTMM